MGRQALQRQWFRTCADKCRPLLRLQRRPAQQEDSEISGWVGWKVADIVDDCSLCLQILDTFFFEGGGVHMTCCETGGGWPYTFQSGASGGLSVFLNTQQYEYTTREINSAGFRVLVHDQSDNTQLLKDASLSVDYNSEVDISVSLTNVSLERFLSQTWRMHIHTSGRQDGLCVCVITLLYVWVTLTAYVPWSTLHGLQWNSRLFMVCRWMYDKLHPWGMWVLRCLDESIWWVCKVRWIKDRCRSVLGWMYGGGMTLVSIRHFLRGWGPQCPNLT